MIKEVIITACILIVLVVVGISVWYVFPQSTNVTDKSDVIVVGTPVKDSLITSPLSISGRARGYWYFEGSFPLELKDSEGQVIAEGHATAQGEWMTEDFVPFLGTLQFNVPPAKGRAVLVLRKDNPSGLAKNDDAIAVPVMFK